MVASPGFVLERGNSSCSSFWVNQVTSHQEISSFLHNKKIHPNRDMAPFICQMDTITVLIKSQACLLGWLVLVRLISVIRWGSIGSLFRVWNGHSMDDGCTRASVERVRMWACDVWSTTAKLQCRHVCC